MVCVLHPQSLPPPARPVHRTMVRDYLGAIPVAGGDGATLA